MVPAFRAALQEKNAASLLFKQRAKNTGRRGIAHARSLSCGYTFCATRTMNPKPQKDPKSEGVDHLRVALSEGSPFPTITSSGATHAENVFRTNACLPHEYAPRRKRRVHADAIVVAWDRCAR